MHRRMFNSNPGFYPRQHQRHLPTPTPASHDNQKCLQTLPSVSWRQHHPCLRSSSLRFGIAGMWRVYLYLPILSFGQTLLSDHRPIPCSVQGVPPQYIIPGSPYPSTLCGTRKGTDPAVRRLLIPSQLCHLRIFLSIAHTFSERLLQAGNWSLSTSLPPPNDPARNRAGIVLRGRLWRLRPRQEQ